MIRRPPRSTLDRSSAASDVYKRQFFVVEFFVDQHVHPGQEQRGVGPRFDGQPVVRLAVSYTHLRAHETVLDLVCRLLLETNKHTTHTLTQSSISNPTVNPQ